jgi:hypothetical protein
MKANWILLGLCAALAALAIASEAPSPEDTDAPAPEAVTPDQAVADPQPPAADPVVALPSTEPTAPANEPEECASVAESRRVECTTSLRDRARDPEFESPDDHSHE